MMWIIFLYLAIGALFDILLERACSVSTEDKTTVFLIHLIAILGWPIVLAFIVYVSFTYDEKEDKK